MTILKATVKLNMVSGNVADQAVNVWHFEIAPEPAEIGIEPAAIASALLGFYEGCASVFTGRMLRAVGSHECVISRVIPGGPGPADDVTTKVIHSQLNSAGWPAAADAFNLPPEVAFALSFRGDLVGIQEESGSTRPAARRRGRVFMGPFNKAVMTPTNEPLLAVAYSGMFLTEYEQMIDQVKTEFDAVTHIRHIVYSPTAAQQHEVVSVHIDNAPDIIRRRGVQATSRETRAIDQEPAGS